VAACEMWFLPIETAKENSLSDNYMKNTDIQLED
jgi:hypothetical protein